MNFKSLYQLLSNPFVLLGIIIALVLLNLKTCSSKKEDADLHKQNEEAMKKTIVVEQNKNKEKTIQKTEEQPIKKD